MEKPSSPLRVTFFFYEPRQVKSSFSLKRVFYLTRGNTIPSLGEKDGWKNNPLFSFELSVHTYGLRVELK